MQRVQVIIPIEEEGVQCHTRTDLIFNDGNLNNPLSNHFALQLVSASEYLEITQPSDLMVFIIDTDRKS